jgi:hypothetical protein
MLYANINLKANTFLNTQSSSLLSLFQTGPVDKPTINTTLLTNLNNSFSNNAGLWTVLSVNDLDMFVDGEVQRISQIFLNSSKYTIKGIKLVLTYHAVLDKTGSLKEAQVTLNGAQFSTKDSTLYSSITSLANTFTSTRETELLSVIV